MADAVKVQFDTSQWGRAFAALDGPVKESLSRRGLVEGGVLLRDAAKSNARMAANAEGNDTRGLLASAIYLQYDDSSDPKTHFTYKISWNAKIAPHGHLIEFGHWMTHKVYKDATGHWWTLKDQPLAAPKWVPARPFLRPTWDSYSKTAIRVTFQRMEREFPILMREHTT